MIVNIHLFKSKINEKTFYHARIHGLGRKIEINHTNWEEFLDHLDKEIPSQISRSIQINFKIPHNIANSEYIQNFKMFSTEEKLSILHKIELEKRIS